MEMVLQQRKFAKHAVTVPQRVSQVSSDILVHFTDNNLLGHPLDSIHHSTSDLQRHADLDTSQWFNAFTNIEDEAVKHVEVQRGDLLVHFAGQSDRERLLNEWCEQSERQDPEWVVYPEDTSYPAEIEQFWESFKAAGGRLNAVGRLGNFSYK